MVCLNNKPLGTESSETALPSASGAVQGILAFYVADLCLCSCEIAIVG